MQRNEYVRWQLDDLEARGIVRSWYGQGAMPGRRWVVETPGQTRSYTTAEAEIFVAGARAALASDAPDDQAHHNH